VDHPEFHGLPRLSVQFQKSDELSGFFGFSRIVLEHLIPDEARPWLLRLAASPLQGLKVVSYSSSSSSSRSCFCAPVSFPSLSVVSGKMNAFATIEIAFPLNRAVER
jgi:hypothetical protein